MLKMSYQKLKYANRVVVTGLGACTPIGSGRLDSIWKNLITGQSGIVDACDHFNSKIGLGLLEDLGTTSEKIISEYREVGINVIAPMIENENWHEFREKNKNHRSVWNRATTMAMFATHHALKDASGKLTDFYRPDRIGVSYGSSLLGFTDIRRLANEVQKSTKLRRSTSPFFIPKILNNTTSGSISIKHNFLGPNTSHTEACATGNHSIGEGYMQIKLGRADAMIVGSSDSCFDSYIVSGFARARALSNSKNPKTASRPFDSDRNGFIIGEGSGTMVLENLETATARGAQIYAEVVGYSATADGYHITAPSETGDAAMRAMRLVIEEEGITPQNVGFINAHATSTPLGDRIEAAAVNKIFGKKTKITSNKGAIGHLLAAAGAVEGIFTCLSLKNSVIPATVGTEKIGEDIEAKVLTKNCYENVEYALSNSFGFGGNNSSLLFKRI